jgi:hypothetical protein
MARLGAPFGIWRDPPGDPSRTEPRKLGRLFAVSLDDFSTTIGVL